MNTATTHPAWLGRALPLLIYAWSLAWILSRQFPDYPPGNDSAYYLIISQGFSTGEPYREYSSPDPEAHTLQGPSAFPLLLSLYWVFLHPNLAALKWIIALIMAAAPALAFLWMKSFIPVSMALLIALSYGCSYMFIVQGNSIMTESLFCPMLYLGLWLSRNMDTGPSARAPWVAMLVWTAIARTRVIGWLFWGVFQALSSKCRLWRVMAFGAAIAAAWLAAEYFLGRNVPVIAYTDRVFTHTFPLLTDPWNGVKALAGNLGKTLFAFSTAGDAQILTPFFYGLWAMDKAKRLACLAVFVWTIWGAWLVWKEHKAVRPWMAAFFLACVPTFVIFNTHDFFRYMLPFFPFLGLFFLAPFQFLAAPAGWTRRLALAAGLIFSLNQALHSSRHDFGLEFIDYPEQFSALHDSLSASRIKPDHCLSPDPFYTYLRTGCPAFGNQGRDFLPRIARHSRGKEVWGVYGPRNEYYRQYWVGGGVVFSEKPMLQAGEWKFLRIAAWPDSAALNR